MEPGTSAPRLKRLQDGLVKSSSEYLGIPKLFKHPKTHVVRQFTKVNMSQVKYMLVQKAQSQASNYVFILLTL